MTPKLDIAVLSKIDEQIEELKIRRDTLRKEYVQNARRFADGELVVVVYDRSNAQSRALTFTSGTLLKRFVSRRAGTEE